MRVGDELLQLARGQGRRSLFVVGTGKNVGKTVTACAIAQAASACGLQLGLTSMGRDGEAQDVIDAFAKPRLVLRPGTLVASARGALPRHPASEMLDLTPWQTAAGNVVIARVRAGAAYELVGAPTAAGLRDCVHRLQNFGCEQIVVDGAIDRVAAIAGGTDAIVIAAGANGARTLEDAIDDVRALARRLRVPRYDPAKPFLSIEGALTAARAAALVAAGERRQIVLTDPTRIAISGKALLGVMGHLELRCEQPLHVVAATIASIGRDRLFEPRAFAQGVAEATGLPTFDVYAASGVRAA